MNIGEKKISNGAAPYVNKGNNLQEGQAVFTIDRCPDSNRYWHGHDSHRLLMKKATASAEDCCL